ncbi:hypothetical protein B0T25DRAFT_317305 [Lasiosphaeria hispida]|uniref:Uncharacterized protein n=1 Tax=Lasiosphaeria hispida TaxID=260671 RepID=A0AAJ0H9N0_9PEZI|nr:hypothetical protein B0T25DRAFT_317305 [Lasiosphaeria hispida]
MCRCQGVRARSVLLVCGVGERSACARLHRSLPNWPPSHPISDRAGVAHVGTNQKFRHTATRQGTLHSARGCSEGRCSLQFLCMVAQARPGSGVFPTDRQAPTTGGFSSAPGGRKVETFA